MTKEVDFSKEEARALQELSHFFASNKIITPEYINYNTHYKNLSSIFNNFLHDPHSPVFLKVSLSEEDMLLLNEACNYLANASEEEKDKASGASRGLFQVLRERMKV